MLPHRIGWALQQLELDPGDRILEIGCGSGKAAEHICAGLRSGRYLGIDRSASAIRAAAAANASPVASGRARFEQRSLEQLTTEDIAPLDKVLAVNVNLFWVRPAQAELAVLRRALTAGGSILLVYEMPSPDTTRAEQQLADHLGRADFLTATIRDVQVPGLFAFRATPNRH